MSRKKTRTSHLVRSRIIAIPRTAREHATTTKIKQRKRNYSPRCTSLARSLREVLLLSKPFFVPHQKESGKPALSAHSHSLSYSSAHNSSQACRVTREQTRTKQKAAHQRQRPETNAPLLLFMVARCGSTRHQNSCLPRYCAPHVNGIKFLT